MRGISSIRSRIPNSNSVFLNTATKPSPFVSSSPFSTSSGGRGRGRGGGPSPLGAAPFDFTPKAPGRPEPDDSKPDAPETQHAGRGRGKPSQNAASPFDFTPREPRMPEPDYSKLETHYAGQGRGRGRGLPTNPPLPSFSPFVSSVKNDQNGMGRGRGATQSSPIRPPETDSDAAAPLPRTQVAPPEESKLPENIYSASSGARRGRVGKPVEPIGLGPEVENRHIRARSKLQPAAVVSGDKSREAPLPKMSREEAVAHAVRVLSIGFTDGGGGGGGSMERGRGRGRGRWAVGGRGDRRRRRGQEDDAEEEYGGLSLGDNADGEKLAQRLGAENMNMLVEGFEEMSGRLLPSPMHDAYLDALDTNFKIEFEEEYLMEEFDRNPELDEKEPMPIRDMLEKLKPFLMAYEGFQSQEEWEEVVEATMKNVPLFNEIVEYYSGPERISAKTQQEELERVAKTVPPSAPASVKKFANRAVLSLQSNPGWGFDKKYQFMDKLVSEVSQHYK